MYRIYMLRYFEASLVPRPRIRGLGTRLFWQAKMQRFSNLDAVFTEIRIFPCYQIHFNPYCMHAHCMICCTLAWKLPPGVLNDTRPRLVERWTIGHMSYSLLDLRDCSAVLQCLFNAGSPLLLITINVFSSHPQHKFVVLTTVVY